jgi:hypothetical protein
MPDVPPLGIEALLVWGREFERQFKATGEFQIDPAVMKAYLRRANEALALLQERDSPPRKHAGGRPEGSGMGALAAALVENGVDQEAAVNMIAQQRKMTPDRVRIALRRHRAKQL